jgi:excisionase family DNA binding protein
MGTVYKTINEAAELLDVSRTTVWRWIREGRLPAYRAGSRTIRIKAEDLERRVQPVRPADQSSPAAEAAKQDIWAGYDPEKALVALRQMRGLFKGVDMEQFKKDMRASRGHDAEGAPDIWANYDPVKVRETLRRGFGILKGIDVDQMKKDIREARGQDSKGRPA